MAIPWNSVNAAYLLRRAGFGPTADEVATYTQLGQEGAVSRLVDYDTIDNGLLEARLEAQSLDLGNILHLYHWWLYRMLYTARPLEEKLTLFWHGHFATSFAKVNDALLMLLQNQTLRIAGMGDFRELLILMSRDPAMLIWLDNALSVKEAPNENYARELLELFGLGIGNYTEEDIKEIARCFTGWTLRGGFEFVFLGGIHDTGTKQVLGQQIASNGVQEGIRVCEIVADHPACAPFICRKLWRYFAAGEPPADVLAAMTATYAASNRSIREVLRTMFMSDAFYAPAVTDEQVKSPVEMYVGTFRSLEADRNIVEYEPFRNFLFNTLLMGQTLFLPPSVKGWDGGRKWVNTSTMLARYNFANSVVTLRGPGFQFVNPTALLERAGATTAEEVVDLFVELLGPLDLGTVARKRLVDYLHTRPDGSQGPFTLDPTTIDTKVRGLMRLLLTSAEYQMNLKGRDPGLEVPVILGLVYKKGKIRMKAAGSKIQQGAHLRVTGDGVEGTQLFPLSLNAKGTKWLVGKKTASTPGGLTLDQAIPAGTVAVFVVENPDGGQSVPQDVTR